MNFYPLEERIIKNCPLIPQQFTINLTFLLIKESVNIKVLCLTLPGYGSLVFKVSDYRSAGCGIDSQIHQAAPAEPLSTALNPQLMS